MPSLLEGIHSSIERCAVAVRVNLVDEDVTIIQWRMTLCVHLGDEEGGGCGRRGLVAELRVPGGGDSLSIEMT